jgi:broad specificity polyphosphatase/5'/3'-nucleotidase SurE
MDFADLVESGCNNGRVMGHRSLLEPVDLVESGCNNGNDK